ncbi:MAG TPA: division/cell wall cluster transcriptional repressor MraZ [Firmicutes bacterium]|nr:division/cell wall cluster transcriptional repressor MraZ [Bacillota bacterium]
MFIGTFWHTIDAKGRLIMPAKFREELGERFIATKGLDSCLFVFPLSEWENQERQLRSLPLSRSDVRAYSRLFFSGAAECEFDKQGRIMIPAHLREYAKLEKDVVIIGVSTRIEIWNEPTWREYSHKAEESYEEIAEKLLEDGGRF